MSQTTEYASQSATISEASPAAPDAGSQFLGLDGDAGDRLRGLLDVEHGIPIGEEAEAEEALLHLFKSGAWPAAGDVTVALADSEWDSATATWTEQPGIRPTTVTVTVPGGGAAGDDVVIDITSVIAAAHAAEDSGGDAYNGLRLSVAEAGPREFYGAAVSDPGLQPRLEVHWNVPADAPANPRPSDGLAVSSDQPELFADFNDDDGEDTISGIHLQIDDVDTMAGPFYDSGELAHDEPSFKLADPPAGAPVTPSLGPGPHYFHMKFRDNHGRWTEWSDVASFIVIPKGTLTLVSPAAIDSPIPVVEHELTDDVQAEIEFSVERKEGGVWQDHYFLPRHPSLAVAHQVPDADRLERGFEYRISKRVWPETEYEDLPGDRAFYEVVLVGEFV